VDGRIYRDHVRGEKKKGKSEFRALTALKKKNDQRSAVKRTRQEKTDLLGYRGEVGELEETGLEKGETLQMRCKKSIRLRKRKPILGRPSKQQKGNSKKEKWKERER